MRTDAEVPEDVWTRVLDHSELEEVLALEQVRLLLVAIVTDADKRSRRLARLSEG